MTYRPWAALAGGLAAGLGVRLFRRAAPEAACAADAPDATAAVPVPAPPPEPTDVDGLVRQMLHQGRYALLLRLEIAGSLGGEPWRLARGALEQEMSLVPEGDVLLERPEDAPADDPRQIAAPLRPRRSAHVVPLLLDRYPVTNRRYQQFVVAGGYGQQSLWDALIWAAVAQFVDGTGRPGPRYWRQGGPAPGEEEHPVVGVCWYEAAAYARWVGKRLPQDAEWVKAASWPVTLGPGLCSQRRYPWGDTLDRRQANVWGTGPGRTVPVEEFAEGASVGGVQQLSGNVWEWTSDDFQGCDHPSGDLVLPVPMKSVRGGAFDTYFESQATCQFASGDSPLARKRNIGFRCAVSVGDLLLERPGGARPTGGEEGCS